jgi:hypothetical protein
VVYVNYEWERYGDIMITLAEATIDNYSFGVHHDLNIEEKDRYGRILFSVDGDKQAFIIVQKVSNGGWIYEGKSTLCIDVWNLTDEEKAQLEQLKEQNDWNRPLQEEKMTKVAIKK